MEEFGYKSINTKLPKIRKIVVSQGLGAATADKKIMDYGEKNYSYHWSKKQLELYPKNRKTDFSN